jgi:predicted ATP-grasp superfamily ATP-dependent carboligase
MKTPAIVLDGNQRSALAAVRSLGRKGIPVIVGDEIPNSLATASRFCKRGFTYPSPYHDPESFFDELLRQVTDLDGAVLMPMTDVTLYEILSRRDLLPKNILVPFPAFDVFQDVSNKVNLFRQASRLGVPIPRTLFSTDFLTKEALLKDSIGLGFPLVLKPGLSRVKRSGKWLSSRVRYARNLEELDRLLDEESFRSFPFLVQERVEGVGLGVFLLMDQGRIIARFAHRRIREKPPSGGVSVLCRSIELPENALNASRKILEEYCWSGVAMIEFKWDEKTGASWLMEINARFWGSLQLAVSAGVDFPFLLYAHALGWKIAPPESYKVGVSSRWELGDLDHLLLRLRRSDAELQLPIDAPSKCRLLGDYFLDFFRCSVRHEVFRPDDPLPFISELRQYMANLLH